MKNRFVPKLKPSVACALLTLLAGGAALAQSNPDDLGAMTPEQRRAYLEDYLKQLTPVDPALSPSPAVSVPAPAAVVPAPAVVSEPVVEPVVPVVPEPVLTDRAPEAPAASAPALVASPVPPKPTEPPPLITPEALSQLVGAPLNCPAGKLDSLGRPYSWVRSPDGAVDAPPAPHKSALAESGHYGVIALDQGEWVLEQRCAQPGVPPLRYASLKLDDGRWTVEFSNRVVLSGGVLVPTARGFLLDQGGSVLDFTLGKLPRSVKLPAGYRLADLQNADVAQTRVVMLLSNDLLKPLLSWKRVSGAWSSVASLWGTEKPGVPPAAILYHLDTGKVWDLGASEEALSPWLARKCSASAWNEGRACAESSIAHWALAADGTRDPKSYFWRYGWVASSRGFDLWEFDAQSKGLTVRYSDSSAVARKQVLPRSTPGVWWKGETNAHVIAIDAD